MKLRVYFCGNFLNMKLKYTLALAALAIAPAAKAQTWIHDTISTEAGYLKNVYYSLENGSAGTAAADNWHIGFSTSRFSPSIIANSADKGVKLYVIATDTTLFGTDLTAKLADSVTAHPMPLYNSNTTWEMGAFNQTAAATYGWSTYDMSTHWLSGRVIFGLISGADSFQVFISRKETTPASSAPVYVFKVAKINGASPVTKTFNVSASPYAGKYFAYYNITTDAFLDREPAATAWDFVFSNYNDENVVFSNTQYKVFGVINNEKLKVAKVDTTDQFDNLNYSAYAYDTLNNSIGRDWKASGQSGVTMTDSLSYFVKVNNGDVWQMVFTAHNSGSAATQPGLVALKKRKVYTFVDTSTAVKNVNAALSTVALAPNPAQGGYTHLIIDAKKAVSNVMITVADINGRIVYQEQKNIQSGFQQFPIRTGNFSAGMYMVNIQGEGIRNTQKLIVQ
jgi:hypothetical protein